MNSHVARAGVLYEQGRPEEALSEVAHALAEDPDDAFAHALAALGNLSLDKIRVAREHAEAAIRCDPELPLSHYAHAMTFLQGNRLEEAMVAAKEALRLDSEDVSHHALVASIHLAAKRYPQAIEAAESGLRLEPRDLACMNLRAHALSATGETGAATEVLEAALAEAPEDDDTHTSLGWACLRGGEAERAKQHFAEALRIDPENEWAREGMTTALKAKNVIYRIALKWFMWVGSMPSGMQWKLLIGLWLLNFGSRSIARTVPALAPWLLPLQIVYIAFCGLTWLADPVFNLFLLADKQGRYALKPRVRRGSILVGLLLLLGALNVLLHFATPAWADTGLTVAMLCLLYCIPVYAAFTVEPGWPTVVASVVSILLVGILAAYCGLALVEQFSDGPHDLVSGLRALLLFAGAIGGIAALWGTNLLLQAEPRT